MQDVEVKGLDELSDKLSEILKEFPEKRRELSERMAQVLKTRVDSQVAKSVNDIKGTVREWQTEDVGSGGGYAAIRAQKGMTGNDSPGAITNYLENGHKIRQPKGATRAYRPRINTPYVSGRHFYAFVRGEIEGEALRLAQEVVDEIGGELG